jgi:uncharacterized protein YqeY
MSDLRNTLNAALKEAMLAKDNARRDVIRGLQSAVKQVEIDTRKELNDDDVMAVLQKEAKKRREAIDESTKAGRPDLAEKEASELTVIETFLPRQLTLEEVKAIAAEIISQTGAVGPSKGTGRRAAGQSSRAGAAQRLGDDTGCRGFRASPVWRPARYRAAPSDRQRRRRRWHALGIAINGDHRDGRGISRPWTDRYAGGRRSCAARYSFSD